MPFFCNTIRKIVFTKMKECIDKLKQGSYNKLKQGKEIEDGSKRETIE